MRPTGPFLLSGVLGFLRKNLAGASIGTEQYLASDMAAFAILPKSFVLDQSDARQRAILATAVLPSFFRRMSNPKDSPGHICQRAVKILGEILDGVGTFDRTSSAWRHFNENVKTIHGIVGIVELWHLSKVCDSHPLEVNFATLRPLLALLNPEAALRFKRLCKGFCDCGRTERDESHGTVPLDGVRIWHSLTYQNPLYKDESVREHKAIMKKKLEDRVGKATGPLPLFLRGLGRAWREVWTTVLVMKLRHGDAPFDANGRVGKGSPLGINAYKKVMGAVDVILATLVLLTGPGRTGEPAEHAPDCLVLTQVEWDSKIVVVPYHLALAIDDARMTRIPAGAGAPPIVLERTIGQKAKGREDLGKDVKLHEDVRFVPPALFGLSCDLAAICHMVRWTVGGGHGGMLLSGPMDKTSKTAKEDMMTSWLGDRFRLLMGEVGFGCVPSAPRFRYAKEMKAVDADESSPEFVAQVARQFHHVTVVAGKVEDSRKTIDEVYAKNKNSCAAHPYKDHTHVPLERVDMYKRAHDAATSAWGAKSYAQPSGTFATDAAIEASLHHVVSHTIPALLDKFEGQEDSSLSPHAKLCRMSHDKFNMAFSFDGVSDRSDVVAACRPRSWAWLWERIERYAPTLDIDRGVNLVSGGSRSNPRWDSPEVLESIRWGFRAPVSPPPREGDDPQEVPEHLRTEPPQGDEDEDDDEDLDAMDLDEDRG